MSQFSKQFFIGVKSHSSAFAFIKEHRLWHFFIWPILLALLILWGGAAGISSLSQSSIDIVKSWIWDNPNPDGIWEKTVYWLLWFAFKILFFYTYYIINKYIVFIVLSPILSIVSERVDAKITGQDFGFSLLQLYKDVLRGIAIAFRNLFLEYGTTLVLLILSVFIPVLAPFYPIAVFFIAAYFYGFAFLDYNSERYQLSFKESVQLVRKNKGLAVGIGTVFSLFFLIPVLGGIIAPILSCVAASIAYLEVFKQLPTSQRIQKK